MNIVGYLINKPDGLIGVRGEAYSYVMAGNGVFIEAENRFMAARIPVAHCIVRGLAPLEFAFGLRHGLIPQHTWELTMSLFAGNRHQEQYVGVSWNDGYHLYYPDQEGEGDRVKYLIGEDIVSDLHSHGTMSAFFSPRDNRDEQGFKVFGVIGNLDERPVVKMRVGVYGYFHEVKWNQVFSGTLTGADDFAQLDKDEKEARSLFWGKHE